VILPLRKAPAATGPVLHARTLDQALVLRLAARCWWFGFFGCIPIAGFGLAVQSRAIFSQAIQELDSHWIAPRFWPYWIISSLFAWGYAVGFGLPGVVLIYSLTVLFQIYFLHHSIPPDAELPWSAGLTALKGGLYLGYTGAFTTIYLVSCGMVAAILSQTS
jgi:hypothetical protein